LENNNGGEGKKVKSDEKVNLEDEIETNNEKKSKH
jgi:hypothetical protein